MGELWIDGGDGGGRIYAKFGWRLEPTYGETLAIASLCTYFCDLDSVEL